MKKRKLHKKFIVMILFCCMVSQSSVVLAQDSETSTNVHTLREYLDIMQNEKNEKSSTENQPKENNNGEMDNNTGTDKELEDAISAFQLMDVYNSNMQQTEEQIVIAKEMTEKEKVVPEEHQIEMVQKGFDAIEVVTNQLNAEEDVKNTQQPNKEIVASMAFKSEPKVEEKKTESIENMEELQPKETNSTNIKVEEIKSIVPVSQEELIEMGKVICGEAGSLPYINPFAVACVIVNRAYYQNSSLMDVMHAPGQFYAYENGNEPYLNAQEYDNWPIYLQAAKEALEGGNDVTKGSLYFIHPNDTDIGFCAETIQKYGIGEEKAPLLQTPNGHMFYGPGTEAIYGKSQ